MKAGTHDRYLWCCAWCGHEGLASWWNPETGGDLRFCCEYHADLAAGLHRCPACATWKPESDFTQPSRGIPCRACSSVRRRAQYAASKR